MEKKILRKQYISENCFVCGTQNQLGLQAAFYELEDHQLVAVFDPRDEYQSYPERLHGGISAAILDETLGRAIMIDEPETWAVTAELTLRYKKPVPLDQPLRVIGRILKNSPRLFVATGEILLPGGETAVSAEGKYIKLTIDKITDVDPEAARNFMMPAEPDRETIDL